LHRGAWQQQGLGGIGADDLATETGIDQVRHPANMVNMGVGEKEIVDLFRGYRKSRKGQHRVIALSRAAVDQDIDAVGGARTSLYQVAGTGDAIFGAEMGNFHAWHLISIGMIGCWVGRYLPVDFSRFEFHWLPSSVWRQHPVIDT